MAAGHPSENQPFLAKRPAAIVTSRRTRTRVVGSEFLFGFLFASSKPSCRTNHNECGTAKRALAESQFGGPMSTSLWYLEGLSFHDDCKRTEPNEHSEDADVVQSRATSVVRDWSIRSIRSADISLSNRLLRRRKSILSSLIMERRFLLFVCFFLFLLSFESRTVPSRRTNGSAPFRWGQRDLGRWVRRVFDLQIRLRGPPPVSMEVEPGGGEGLGLRVEFSFSSKKKRTTAFTRVAPSTDRSGKSASVAHRGLKSDRFPIDSNSFGHCCLR